MESDNDDPAPENNSAIVSTQVLESPDRAVLETLYHSTGGPDWISDRKWLSAEPIGDWYGVDTDDSRRVTRLNLAHNNLNGEMPAVLARLANLRELRLHNNNLDGPMPSWLTDLTGLQRLYLASNGFTGCVPEGLADVPDNDLGSLGLDDCGLGTGQSTSVSAGIYHTCGVRRDGSVACWGVRLRQRMGVSHLRGEAGPLPHLLGRHKHSHTRGVKRERASMVNPGQPAHFTRLPLEPYIGPTRLPRVACWAGRPSGPRALRGTQHYSRQVQLTPAQHSVS